jgi:hypothetical protein
MNMEQRLNMVADRYRNLGFKVVLHPSSDDLPPFAKDFKVQILATKDDGSVLGVAKATPSELQADEDVARYAEITEKQPGWRLDVFVLGPDAPAVPAHGEVREPSDEDLRHAVSDAERMLREGFVRQGFVTAWAALEGAMRRKLIALGGKATYGTSPRTMLNELFSAGIFSNRVFRDLEGLFQLRNIIVHGFAVPQFPTSAVEFLIGTANQLLETHAEAKQTA